MNNGGTTEANPDVRGGVVVLSACESASVRAEAHGPDLPARAVSRTRSWPVPTSKTRAVPSVAPVSDHRAWMARAYALALAAGTQVFTMGVGNAVFGISELNTPLGLGAGWGINLAVVECIIRRRDRPGRPRGRRSPSDQSAPQSCQTERLLMRRPARWERRKLPVRLWCASPTAHIVNPMMFRCVLPRAVSLLALTAWVPTAALAADVPSSAPWYHSDPA